MKVNMNKLKTGTAVPALLIIAASFAIAVYGILFVLTLQFDYANRQVASEEALNIAEAGINYYRWHLLQYPDDYQDGTGATGPYLHDFNDPEGSLLGQYELAVTPPADANGIITITSTAWTKQYPKVKRRIKVQYGKISLTYFAFLHNSNLWFGSDIVINGPVFSNGGIRQDGTNTSIVQSAKETYTCGNESGCNTPLEKSGIWGTGKDSSLWEYPANSIDFDSIRLNFSHMKTVAESLGLYLAPSGDQGYHLVFKSDGTVDVYQVTGVAAIKAYSEENECENLLEQITSETLLNTYSIATKPVIFVEDNVWTEGTVKGKTTLVAARFPLGTYNTNVWIPDNLVYFDKSGNNRLGLIAEKDIIFTRDVPEYFEVDGAILAQNGRIIRHHYGYFGCKSTGADKIKKEFKFYGSLISNQRSYWNFSSGPKSPASGFQKSILDYDSSNYVDPPPYFPTLSQLQFISWSEEKI
jgi:hypothetical protein